MSTMRRRRAMSIVEEQGVHSSSCGYCKSASSISVAQRLWAHKLTVDDYQELLNRGWRRSGMVLYKNNMHRSCCPPLSIRLDVNAFRISKDQARALRRMQRYLEGGSQLSPGNKDLDGKVTRKKCMAHDAPEFDDSPTTAKKKKTSEEAAVQLTASLQDAITRCVEAGALPRGLDVPQVTVQRASQQVRAKMKLATEGGGELEYTSSVAFAIAAALRRRPTTEEASKEELSSSLVAETLVSQLRETDRYIPQACKGHLNFLTAGCPSAAEGTPRENEPQERVFVRPPTLPPPSCLKPRHMSTQMKRSEFDREEYALYRKYQMAVHNDEPEDVGEGTYRRFLVDSPLVYVAPTQGNDISVPSCGYGTFHQQYRIDGKLVAVGVLDVLPRCLSSYYFFWDPDLASLSLGKFSALREIGWVQETNKACPALSYYYLGNYIHTCPKMRYKAAYAPSELLCPSTYIWVPYGQALPDLESAQYTRLSHSPSEPEKKGDDAETDVEMKMENGSEKDENRSASLDQAILLLDKKCLTFERLKELIDIPAADMDILTKELTLYMEGVGQELASRMVFVSTL